MNILCAFVQNLCFGKCGVLKLQSMGHTNHKFPVYAHGNVQTHLKSIVVQVHGNLEMRLLQEIAGILQQ